MTQVLGEKPKIIATVRSIPDCMASFVRVAKPDDLDEFIYSGILSTHLKAAYMAIQSGYDFAPECFFCIVEYEDLVADPKAQLDRIHEFLDLPDFEYDFTAIDGTSVPRKMTKSYTATKGCTIFNLCLPSSTMKTLKTY